MQRETAWQGLAALLAVATLLLLTGCGRSTDEAAALGSASPTRDEASRFLAQASFGATDSEIDRVVAAGYSGWIEEQFGRTGRNHLPYLNARNAAIAATGARVSENDFLESFWHSTVAGQDQLRQRMAFALSQIFVISFEGALFEQARGVGSYHDMLASHAFGNFRSLLRDVALHPMMGIYLSHLRNQKEASGRVPDENFAREVMQLFSIGLYELEPDGRLRLDAAGRPIETYGSSDVGGLARVFTGWSWYAGTDPLARTEAAFFGTEGHPDRDWQPMQPYQQHGAGYHSTGEKRFLGRVIPASSVPDPEGDLDAALDTLFHHPNVGPFIGRLLIQRLVTSNPSPSYIRRVAAAFADNGQGVRGDMKAVLRAVLLDTEARVAGGDPRAGKLREPVLRFAHLLRAFRAHSVSGRWLHIDNTNDPANALGQTPMRAPSVFNFFRPDFTPNQVELIAAGMVAPEFQIVSEISVAGYLNFLQRWLDPANVYDVRLDFGPEQALAADPTRLVAHLNTLLAGGRLSSGLRARLVRAVEGRVVPAPLRNAQGSTTNTAEIDAALRDRVGIAVLLIMASPDYLMQQ